ncbi:MAG TPA: GTPase HflX [Terriglobales bacterium]|nr:GTPase HflX [Terriglobales bacterium]
MARSPSFANRDEAAGANGAERAFLVGIDLRAKRSSGPPPQAKLARQASEVARGDDGAEPTNGDRKPRTAPEAFTTEESMAEFRELATSAGAEVVGEVVQRRDKLDPATLIGRGKLEEIQGAVAGSQADVVLFDHDLSPSQQRNIERELDARVIDRTQLILDIFARHARTREGQLQVELAQLEYLLPRLAGRGVEMSQLGGGIGTRGPGETQLETDRRKIYRRMRHVQQQLENVRRIRAQQRQRRESVPVETVALVGYTNAGKSTLFNALTKAGVLASSRMFATLDPTLRSITLPSKRKVLLSDTVGFIRNLPHTLVTSFRATLEEVQRASLVLHVSDATSPNAAEQQEQVEKVLAELEAQEKPTIQVLNKIDLLSSKERESLSAGENIVQVSAMKGDGLENLLERIDAILTADPLGKMTVSIPQSEGKLLATIEARGKILNREFRRDRVDLTVEGPESLLRNLERFRVGIANQFTTEPRRTRRKA